MPASDSDDRRTAPKANVCPSCGSKVSLTWSRCPTCSESLPDADSPADGPTDEPLDFNGDETGCPKCSGEEADVDDIATTGTGLSKLFNIQTRRFRVVTCANCGYSELYRGQDADVMLDLFIG